MIKAVIFDIGGVVVKFHMRYIYRDLEKKFGIRKEYIRRRYNELDPLISTNKISAKEFWSELARKLKMKNVNSLKRAWLESFKRNIPIDQKVSGIINDIKEKGYTVAALSNTIEPHEKLHWKLGHYKFFDQVFLSNRIGMEKPDIRIYRYVARKLNINPRECVFIDNKMRHVIGARKAGMKSILFKNASQLRQGLKKYL